MSPRLATKSYGGAAGEAGLQRFEIGVNVAKQQYAQ